MADFTPTDADKIGRDINALTSDVLLLCSRYGQALDLLEQWMSDFTDERMTTGLVLRTKGLLERGGRDVSGIRPG